MHIFSNRKPIVFRSFTRSFGPNSKAAVQTDGSVKYLVSEVRIAVFERKFGFQAEESSRTNIFFNAFMYEVIVISEMETASFAEISAAMEDIFACVPTERAYERRILFVRSLLRSTLSTLEISTSTIASK